MKMFQSDPFFMKINGPYALFTDPMSKGNGEKFTYQVPTVQALLGIVEAVYWKPTLYYVIDEVKVLNKIQTETKSILLPMLNGSKDLSHYTYLRDVAYAVKFHFEWAEHRPDLIEDRNEKKHEQILLRSMQRGGRHDIFLGTRECIGSVERMRQQDYEMIKTPLKGCMSLGIMFHSFSYAEQIKNNTFKGVLYSQFASITMKDGIITFIRPEQCTIRHKLHNYKVKEFHEGTYTPVGKVWSAYEADGRKMHEPITDIAENI